MDDNQTPGEPRFDEPTGQYTTGHSWDGIEELNTPMPRWWLGIFYLSILFGIVYMVLMPAIPLVNGYTIEKDLSEIMQKANIGFGGVSQNRLSGNRKMICMATYNN